MLPAEDAGITLDQAVGMLHRVADALARFQEPEPAPVPYCQREGHDYQQGRDEARGTLYCPRCGDVRPLAPARQLGFAPGRPAAEVAAPYPGHAGPCPCSGPCKCPTARPAPSRPDAFAPTLVLPRPGLHVVPAPCPQGFATCLGQTRPCDCPQAEPAPVAPCTCWATGESCCNCSGCRCERCGRTMPAPVGEAEPGTPEGEAESEPGKCSTGACSCSCPGPHKACHCRDGEAEPAAPEAEGEENHCRYCGSPTIVCRCTLCPHCGQAEGHHPSCRAFGEEE